MASTTLSENDLRNLRIEQFGPHKVYNLCFPSVGRLRAFFDAPEVAEVPMAMRIAGNNAASAGGGNLDASFRPEGNPEDGRGEFLAMARCLEMINRRNVAFNAARPAFVGSRPNVPAYIAGAPKNMYRMARPKEKKVVQVFLNLAYTGKTSEAQVRNRGILALNLVRVLEMNDFIVEFRAFEASMEQQTIYLCGVMLKKPGERLNPGNCYYPLCGQSFLRRAATKLKSSLPMETQDEKQRGRVTGGELQELLFLNKHWKIPVERKLTERAAATQRQAKRTQIFIGTPQSLGITGKNIFRDADSFLRNLNLDKMIAVPNYETEEE